MAGKKKPWGQRKMEEWFGGSNPIMPSKEKREIQRLEDEERRMQERNRKDAEKAKSAMGPSRGEMMAKMQETGEDYPARWHRYRG